MERQSPKSRFARAYHEFTRARPRAEVFAPDRYSHRERMERRNRFQRFGSRGDGSAPLAGIWRLWWVGFCALAGVAAGVLVAVVVMALAVAIL